MVKKKTIFIMSSTFGKGYASVLRDLLNSKLGNAGYVARCWFDQEVFEPTNVTIKSLGELFDALSEQGGYAVAMMTPDYETVMKNGRVVLASDNVVFELGMAVAKLGLAHSIVVRPDLDNFHMLSDLDGVTYLKYKYSKRLSGADWLTQSLSAAADIIVSHVKKNT
ncbi:MAG: nucleotide-binding protein [Candidatus Bathyarchaeota archaeon]|nr:nucleotide-binding protein [Candidatus Termiticorpusculum sp.]